MARLVLYDNPVSSNALKVRVLLAELALDHERREVPMPEPRPDWYLAVNPFGRIPAIDDDGLLLSESHAILRHLARREGREDLYPADIRDAALVDEFLDRWHTRIRPAFFRHEVPALGYAPGAGGFYAVPPDTDAAAEVERRIQPVLTLLDGLVSPGSTLLGRFTIADCAVAPVLFRTTKTGLDLDAYPTLTALRETLLARPAFARADPVG